VISLRLIAANSQSVKTGRTDFVNPRFAGWIGRKSAVENQWFGCSMVFGLGDWVTVRNSGLKPRAQQEWAGIATDGTICADTVYQKFGRNGLEEFAWHVGRGALDLARCEGANRGRGSVLRKREPSAKRGLLDHRLLRVSLSPRAY
jgi:hypothetical protein